MNLTDKQTRMQEQILKKLYGVEVFEDGKHWYLTNQGTITLPRIIKSLEEHIVGYDTDTNTLYGLDNRYERYSICNRKLLNSDNTDATLFDQDQSTQDAIATLLGRKD